MVNKMDARTIDENGLTVCPCCNTHYKPVLGERPRGDDRPIQKIFPKATKVEREQLITGICSEACWNKFIGNP
jgi:hypothetical protein